MGTDRDAFEFQRLHGMGETLHEIVRSRHGTRCRIYAPVGAHRDLLAYLVRRLLENGANSSFVNQIVDEEVPPEEVAKDPFDALAEERPHIPTGLELFLPERANSMGFDLAHPPTLAAMDRARDPWRAHVWEARPLLAAEARPAPAQEMRNPADHSELVGRVAWASEGDVDTALDAARVWDAPAAERAEVLRRVADLYEEHYGELFALCAREAGKMVRDAVAELREAADFLRYYAAHAPEAAPVGRFACISPWNFPLAIFTGQVSAALAAGNAVLAKPAEQSPLIAHRAVQLFHAAGVPRAALQLLPGAGEVGAALTSDARTDGVAFTGGTDTARKIRTAMAEKLAPGAPLVAETGGLNAMIVDSTALPEQAVQAIVESAFQSAGQRCSALRGLYVQEDIAPEFTKMLTGAMDALVTGDPWALATDVSPVIDRQAQGDIAAYIDAARAEGRVIHQLEAPEGGSFVGPALIRVPGIGALEREVFGPVLHLATFKAEEIDAVIDAINGTGYGLTFGLQTRIDDRVQHVADRIHAGNVYVNRNQIGAIVGSQPFGGEGLSGTGPKAGGPHYLPRFVKHEAPLEGAAWETGQDIAALERSLKQAAPKDPPRRTETLPGPTGESNRLSTLPRLPALCLGPGAEATAAQAEAVRALGGVAVEAEGSVPPEALTRLAPLSLVLWWGDAEAARALDRALAAREGPLVPLVTGLPDPAHVLTERHVCVDTTAAGGNAALLAGAA
jgi:RHH-type proline utilization regulon transcriptional repressor/proline dehydrogenase/delta 1-pyrroline-5-carboxylate dehydrogenase